MCKTAYCFDRLELQVDKTITSVRFTYSDKTTVTAYPFVYQPINIEYDVEGIETVKKQGNEYCCVRYTPTSVGNLGVEYFVDNDIVKSEVIDILPSDNHGYIKISEKDKRYLEYSDGVSYFPIGMNMAFPTLCGKSDGTEFGLSNTYKFMGLRQYERWFKKASENGVNMVRLWLGHEYFCPDTETAYELDNVQFSKIDEIIKLAKKYNLKLKLTIEQFRFFDHEYEASSSSYADDILRKFNKRLYIDGKPCMNMQEWLNDSKWGDAWLYKVKELAKRYSGDTTIFAVELWNEMNCVGDFKKRHDIIEWNKKYLPVVKEFFPNNMVINSLGSLDTEIWNEFYHDFCWDKSDFQQMHRYLDQGAKYERCTINPIETVQEGFELMKPDNQPVLLAETGAVNNCHSGPFKYYPCDDDGLILADCVYTPIFCNSCGVGNIWHWDERYVESKNLYHMYKPIEKLLNGVDMAGESFESLDVSTDKAYILLLKGKTTTLGYIRNKSASWQNILRDLNPIDVLTELSVPISAENVELIRVWDDDISVENNKNELVFKNIKRGILFKL